MDLIGYDQERYNSICDDFRAFVRSAWLMVSGSMTATPGADGAGADDDADSGCDAGAAASDGAADPADAGASDESAADETADTDASLGGWLASGVEAGCVRARETRKMPKIASNTAARIPHPISRRVALAFLLATQSHPAHLPSRARARATLPLCRDWDGAARHRGGAPHPVEEGPGWSPGPGDDVGRHQMRGFRRDQHLALAEGGVAVAAAQHVVVGRDLVGAGGIERLKTRGGYRSIDVMSLSPDHPERDDHGAALGERAVDLAEVVPACNHGFGRHRLETV
eukprot:gene11582-15474_t